MRTDPDRVPVCWGVTMEKYLSHLYYDNNTRLYRHSEDKEVRVALARTDRARNMIVKRFLVETTLGWLLFLDSDMVFPPDLAERLLRWNKPVISALYFQRQDDYHPHMYRWSDKVGPDGEQLMSYIEEWDEGLVKCDAVGAGALLVQRWVYEQLKEPWFVYLNQMESEDISFCRKLKNAGIPVWCDTSTECGHLAEVVIGHSNYYVQRLIAQGKLPKSLLEGKLNERITIGGDSQAEAAPQDEGGDGAGQGGGSPDHGTGSRADRGVSPSSGA